MVMDIRLVRIDDRLVHGQVATVWTKISKAERILVISDEVAQDHLRKTLLRQVAPPGVKVSVIPVEKFVEIYFDDTLNQFRAMLLFTNPTDVARIVQKGVKIDAVNIGGMSYSDGKKMITNAVAVGKRDIQAFEYLNYKGIHLDIRKVVADNKLDLMQVLKKEGLT
ncbi:mannose/fructose/sorbose PTS transporter subunit IIB [Trichococcus paludicola]|uniref:mannose/fructose/sorbose PTS transporter subunit IIB n=1 Tax=Trichococcus paludicola TaxID=2052942 RepID=UPI0019015B88|nr:mannose/fructose/sorbose PTS transporter subunit IIB [Trichococcus paludicola]